MTKMLSYLYFNQNMLMILKSGPALCVPSHLCICSCIFWVSFFSCNDILDIFCNADRNKGPLDMGKFLDQRGQLAL